MQTSSYGGFVETLQITFTVETPGRVEAVMPITPTISQPHGFVHGGATLSLLESVASRGAELLCDLETSVPFGIHMDARHVKSGTSGSILGVATLARTEGSKQYWDVAAYDDDGDVMSQGVFVTKTVTRERLAEIMRQREAARNGS